MKKTLISFLISITLSASAQKDSTISDTTELITAQDLQLLLNEYSDKVSHRDFINIEAAFQEVFKRAVARRKKVITKTK